MGLLINPYVLIQWQIASVRNALFVVTEGERAGKFIAFLRASLSLSRVQSLLLCQTLGWREGLKYPITLINLATATWLPKLVPLISHDVIC